MPIGLATAAIIGASALGAGAQIGGGIAQRRAAKKAAEQVFGEQEEAELRRLERLQREGALGLNERERATVEAELAAARGGLARSQAEEALRGQAAGQALGRAVTGRDVFLRQQALQAGAQQAQAEAAGILRQREAEARAEQRGRMAALEAQRAQAESIRMGGTAALAQGIAGAAGTISGAATSVAAPVASKELEAALTNKTNVDIDKMLRPAEPAPAFRGGMGVA